MRIKYYFMELGIDNLYTFINLYNLLKLMDILIICVIDSLCFYRLNLDFAVIILTPVQSN